VKVFNSYLSQLWVHLLRGGTWIPLFWKSRYFLIDFWLFKSEKIKLPLNQCLYFFFFTFFSYLFGFLRIIRVLLNVFELFFCLVLRLSEGDFFPSFFLRVNSTFHRLLSMSINSFFFFWTHVTFFHRVETVATTFLFLAYRGHLSKRRKVVQCFLNVCVVQGIQSKYQFQQCTKFVPRRFTQSI
jgi:hypothetical protein